MANKRLSVRVAKQLGVLVLEVLCRGLGLGPLPGWVAFWAVGYGSDCFCWRLSCIRVGATLFCTNMEVFYAHGILYIDDPEV